jgi:predicted secreted protein
LVASAGLSPRSPDSSRVATRVTGGVIVITGTYLALTHILGLSI